MVLHFRLYSFGELWFYTDLQVLHFDSGLFFLFAEFLRIFLFSIYKEKLKQLLKIGLNESQELKKNTLFTYLIIYLLAYLFTFFLMYLYLLCLLNLLSSHTTFLVI